MATVKKYPIIGGPLDGDYANSKDFQRGYESLVDWPEGQFYALRHEYTPYNAGARNAVPSMVYLHRDLLRNVVRRPQ